MKQLGGVFDPIIPGIITAGLCAGFASLLAQLVPYYGDSRVWSGIYQLLNLVNVSFMTYMTAWIGYSAAGRFGATPILGGMLGMITGLDGVNTLARLAGLYNAADPVNSILCSGRGGVIAILCGAWVLGKVEGFIRKRMPRDLDMVLSPLLTLLAVLAPYLLVIMPVTGSLTTLVCRVLELLCMSGSLAVRMLTGFISAALFLPMVMLGMQYAFSALYSMQLEALGYVTLFPALAMAGAGQVGAGLALLLKAKKIGNHRFAGVISASILPGMLGVGTPLLYSVTLPLGKPFLTAGLAAGFGGAFIMATEVASASWGPSGLLALPMMTAGPHGAVMTAACYLAGLAVSCVLGFLFTHFAVRPEELADK